MSMRVSVCVIFVHVYITIYIHIKFYVAMFYIATE